MNAVSLAVLAASLLTAATLFAQAPPRQPVVSMSTVAPLTVVAGKLVDAKLAFHILPGFHVNSNRPRSSLLIATGLQFTPPASVSLGKITYPPGKDFTFEFAPKDPVNVYSGDFNVDVQLRPAQTLAAGTYQVPGELKYQACDEQGCYPPKKLPVTVELHVASSGR
jgi:hypothetical protein